MTPPQLSGRVVAVTGGARGIGAATAQALREAGALVAVGDLDVSGAPDAVALDVADEASFAGFLEHVERDLGPLDVLVNNAGIMPIGPFVDEEEGTARKVLEVNVLGAMNGMRLALRSMLPRGRGHVVNVASVAGKAPAPGGASYAASKAAVVSLTETLRVEHRGSGVEFTCVMPSFTQTELISGTKGTRFIRTVRPDEVAAAIVGAIDRPRPDVYVPGVVGAAVRANTLFGRRFRDVSARAIRADRTFLDIDAAAREGYERRIGPGSPASLPSGDPPT